MNRPVRIMSVAMKPMGEDAALSILGDSVRSGPDLAILPETCIENQAEGAAPDSRIVREVREIARLNGVNVIFPLYLAYGGVRRVNSALAIDRNGEIIAAYHKLYPYWSEFDLSPPCAVTDGGDITAQFDFGKVGLAICFDANFPSVWQGLRDAGAELVAWCSAYSAGSQLSAYGLIHHYPIVTCTMVPDAAVYDIDGKEIAYMKGDGDHCVFEHTIDLDRCIFHENFNLDKVDKLVRERGGDVEVEKHYWREQWLILRSKNPGTSARELAAAYGMTELVKYQNDSMTKIDAMRIKL